MEQLLQNKQIENLTFVSYKIKLIRGLDCFVPRNDK